MRLTHDGPDDALAAARGVGNTIAGQRSVPDTITAHAAPKAAELRAGCEDCAPVPKSARPTTTGMANFGRNGPRHGMPAGERAP